MAVNMFARSQVKMHLGLQLFTFARSHDVGTGLMGWSCCLGDGPERRLVTPDALFVSYKALPRARKGNLMYCPVPPELIVEIPSPLVSRTLLASKLAFYRQHRIKLLWLLDLEGETITVMTADGGVRLLRAGDTLDGGEALPAFQADVAELFAQMRE